MGPYFLLKHGFTLLETVIYFTLGALIMIVITQVFVSQTRFGERQTRQSDITRSATSGIEILKIHIQSAKTVVASRTFGGILYTSSSDSLILELPTIDSSGNLISGSSDYVVFFRDPLNTALLKITTEAAVGSARSSNTKIVSAFVNSVEFHYNKSNIIDADAIDAALNTSLASSSKTFRATGRARIKLYNK